MLLLAHLPKSIYLPDQMIVGRMNEAAPSADVSIAGGDGGGPQQTHEMMIPSHQIDSIIGPGVLVLLAATVVYICGAW